MSFENGYNIKNYIEATINAYNGDKKIFDKCLKVLNIYMNRREWPTSFGEFGEIAEEYLNVNIESFCRDIMMFESQGNENHPNLKNWKADVDPEFLEEAILFCKIVTPIVDNYYQYINNPIGIKQIVKMDSNGGWSTVKIFRIDGVSIDLRLNAYDIENLYRALKAGGPDECN